MLAEHGGFMPNIDLLRRQMITKQWMEWGTLISVRQYENCIKLLGTTHRRTIKWTNPILRDFQVFITGKDSNWMILLTNDMTIGWDSILSGRTFHLNVVFFFLLSFHWRNKPLLPTLPQTLRGWKRSFRELMSSYIASTSFRVGRFGWFASAA